MKKFLLAPALAALAMFVFGALFWTSPLPYRALSTVTDNAAASDVLGRLFPATGTYLIPGPEMKDQAQLTALLERGPSAEVRFIREGHPVMEPRVFLLGYLHYFAVALILGFLMEKAGPSFKGYSGRVQFSAGVGLAGAVLICLSNPIWWHHPWGWELMTALYAVLVFTVGGLVLARFFTPRPAA